MENHYKLIISCIPAEHRDIFMRASETVDSLSPEHIIVRRSCIQYLNEITERKMIDNQGTSLQKKMMLQKMQKQIDEENGKINEQMMRMYYRR
jgi:hypothetical protein